MTAAKFESYLREEGLETIIAERARRGESAAAGREIYSRSAKSILGDGTDRNAVLSEPFGFRLEIVPVANPRLATSKSIDVRVLFENRPLEDVLVVAIPRSRPSQRVSARTDATGRVQLTGGAGEWMVKAVHMIPAPADSDADWESIWATLTFSRR